MHRISAISAGIWMSSISRPRRELDVVLFSNRWILYYFESVYAGFCPREGDNIQPPQNYSMRYHHFHELVPTFTPDMSRSLINSGLQSVSIFV